MERKFLLLLVCSISIPIPISVSASRKGNIKLVTSEEIIGDPFEDCIVTREPLRPEVCNVRGAFRSIDGTCNNLKNPIQGASFTTAERFIEAQYARENSIPIGFPFFSRKRSLRARVTGSNIKAKDVRLPFNRRDFRRTVSPSAQEVSDGIFRVASESVNKNNVAHIFMTFGQFIDHDLVIIENEPEECQKPVCTTLEAFKYPCNPIIRNTNPRRRKVECNPFARSRAACNLKSKNREQVNQLTSYIDGSMIYGSTDDEAREVRTEDGLLRHSEENLLPFNPFNIRPCQNFSGCFLAGDIRVNENTALASMHTVWLRLHNVVAKELKNINKQWDSNRIFEEARQIVIGILQNIVYEEFLPLITDLPKNDKYNPKVSAGVRNSFATAAYRFGHSLIRNSFDQLDKNFKVVRPALPLQNAFNNIAPILNNGIEETIFGLLGNDSQPVDTTFSQGIAERLFIPPNERGFQNLVAINIQRGRDHGLPSYTEFRKFCKIRNRRRSRGFNRFGNEINRNRIRALQRLYKNVNNHIDLFPAGVAETPVRGKLVGPTFGCLIREQFQNARVGDRFFFTNTFSSTKIKEIKKMTLAKVLCLTLDGIVSIQDNVFKRFVPGRTRRNACDVGNKNKFIDFNEWCENN